MPKSQTSIERFIKQLKPIKAVLPGVKVELENRANEPELGITSLPGFNKKIWGLKKGLTVIGGRTSQGKTALALQIAYDIADQLKEVIYLSLEMTTESLIERLFCNLNRIDNYSLLIGKMKTDSYYQEAWGLFEKLLNIPLKISCGLGKTFEDINILLQLLNPKPKVIIIDYIQAIQRFQNERLEIDDYIIKFREICLQNNIAGILVSQNSRKVFEEESKEPSLANLKSTGCLEELSDTVLLVFWPHFYNENIDKNIYKIIIAKQRNGRTGEYLVNYIPENYRFIELTKQQENNNIIVNLSKS